MDTPGRPNTRNAMDIGNCGDGGTAMDACGRAWTDEGDMGGVGIALVQYPYEFQILSARAVLCPPALLPSFRQSRVTR